MLHHLDPNTLAAFAENGLTNAQTASMFAHLSECRSCRDWFDVYCDGQAKPVSMAPFWFAPAQIACAVLLAGLTILVALLPSTSKHQAKTTAATSWIFARNFALISTGRHVTLPAALAAARLGSQASFLTATSPLRTKSDKPISQTKLYSRISLKTNLGVRSISLSLVRELSPGI